MYASVAMVTAFSYKQVMQFIVIRPEGTCSPSMKFVTPSNAKVIKGKILKTGRPKNMPRRLSGFVHSLKCLFRVLPNLSSLPPERVQLTVKSKKEKMAGSKWAKGQDGLLLFTPPPSPPLERVALTENSKKETNGRVKMGKSQNGLRVKMGCCC